MTVYKVRVKWGKELYNDLELNVEEEPLTFKAQLFALTGVAVDRQKVMFKGKVIANEWPSVGLKDGITLLLMGTVDKLPEAPQEKPKFVEDMTDNEFVAALDLPTGLTNLGNTCYMNATVQCLKTVPELNASLTDFESLSSVASGFGNAEVSQTITAALRDLYENMDKNATVAPVTLLHVFYLAFPHFAEKNSQGVVMQQDANECWTELIRMLQEKLKTKENRSFIEKYFGGSFNVEMKCLDSEEEPVSRSKETFNQLSCFISQEVRYLSTGLSLKLKESLTKFSPSLKRDAQYEKVSRIDRLPAYLSIQFVRFFYKEKDAVNAKILKDVKFPLVFDAFEMCTESLQEKLAPMRARFKEIEDAKVAVSESGDPKGKDKKEPDSSKQFSFPYSFPDDPGSNNSGYYDLQAVLTHKGRSSSSGHYVAWIRRKHDEWFKCDDDDVSLVSSEEILKLSGGGDWHCAYVLLYGPRILRVDEKPMDLD